MITITTQLIRIYAPTSTINNHPSYVLVVVDIVVSKKAIEIRWIINRIISPAAVKTIITLSFWGLIIRMYAIITMDVPDMMPICALGELAKSTNIITKIVLLNRKTG
jgi:hypothetical protein